MSNIFVKRLDQALSKIDLPIMRHVARVYRERLARTKAPIEEQQRKPLTGIYWWMPYLEAGGIVWRVLAFHEKFYGELTHPVIWEKYGADELASGLGLQSVPREVRNLYAALPRGRVVQALDRGYRIYHGIDEPPGSSMSNVQSEFKFTEGGRNKMEFDEHEQMIPDDYHQLVELIGVDLGLSPKPTGDVYLS